MTLKKPLLIATLASSVAMAAVSTKAEAGDPVLGALIGGGIGAAIGHDVNRHGGAAVGGVLGAIVGSSIASDHYYYGDGYYAGPGYSSAPRYYSAPVYGPSYYAPAYPSYGVTYVYRDGPRHHHHHRHDWRDDRRHWR